MTTYSDYLNKIFPGVKVQKISVNAGFSCPNRDGTIGFGGCDYCRNDSFSPSYCQAPESVTEQLQKGKAFFSRKYPEMKYLAYFQSYTNTYGKDTGSLCRLYEEATRCEDVVGIVIGTRPDTLPDQVLDMIAEINRSTPVFIEIGAETSDNRTLSLINRHHTWEDVVCATTRAASRGLHCGLHLIAGLPGEDSGKILENVKKACSLPIETLKLHQLQVLKGTALLAKWESGEIELKPFGLDEYLALCAQIADIVPSHIVIERFLAQSPPEMVVAPRWGLKNYQFTNLLERLIRTRHME